MAAPQIQEITLKSPTKILIHFDQALDDTIPCPLSAFSINYGKIPITSYEYYSTAMIVLDLGRSMRAVDKLELNYQPPENMAQALRAPVADNASTVTIRRNVVRAFYKVPVLNQLTVDESAWNLNSNLGSSGDYVLNPDDPDSGGGTNPGFPGCIPTSGGGNNNGGNSGSNNGGEGGSNNGGGDPGNPVPMGTRASGSRLGSEAYGAYPVLIRPSPRSATPDDFVLAYGLREAIQLSNIDDADATQPNTDKIWMAIQDACALIDNYIVQAGRAGKVLISSNRRRTALIIARYYLDTVRRREDVYKDYELAIKDLDKAKSMEQVERPDVPSWLDPCNPSRGNGIRSWRIPQVYNGVSGKGLSGWWNDAAYDQTNDWRYSRKNSENNNNERNWGTSRASGGYDDRIPNQPTDGGGSNAGTGLN